MNSSAFPTSLFIWLPKSTISVITDALQYLNTAHCVTGNGTDQITLNKSVNSRFPMRKGLALQKLLIYFYALDSLTQHLHAASSSLPPSPPTVLCTEMSQYNITAYGYDKHLWIIFLLWCYEVSQMYLISTTKAVIEFVEGRKKSIFVAWRNGSWNQQH